MAHVSEVGLRRSETGLRRSEKRPFDQKSIIFRSLSELTIPEMAISRSDITPSPVSVANMYLNRYAVVYHGGNANAYDLYDTMNRQAHFRETGFYNFGRASANIRTLQRIRNGELTATEATFMAPREVEPHWDVNVPLTSHEFFSVHGIRVNISFYEDEQNDIVEQEQAARALLEIRNDVNDAHMLWNLWDDGVASQAETVGTWESRAVVAEMLDEEEFEEEGQLFTQDEITRGF